LNNESLSLPSSLSLSLALTLSLALALSPSLPLPLFLSYGAQGNVWAWARGGLVSHAAPKP